jgi:hypothetical protein
MGSHITVDPKIRIIEGQLRNIINEKGEALSPILPDHIKNFLIDIDGTICDDVPNEEPERMAVIEPYPDALEILNRWYTEAWVFIS